MNSNNNYNVYNINDIKESLNLKLIQNKFDQLEQSWNIIKSKETSLIDKNEVLSTKTIDNKTVISASSVRSNNYKSERNRYKVSNKGYKKSSDITEFINNVYENIEKIEFKYNFLDSNKIVNSNDISFDKSNKEIDINIKSKKRYTSVGKNLSIKGIDSKKNSIFKDKSIKNIYNKNAIFYKNSENKNTKGNIIPKKNIQQPKPQKQTKNIIPKKNVLSKTYFNSAISIKNNILRNGKLLKNTIITNKIINNSINEANNSKNININININSNININNKKDVKKIIPYVRKNYLKIAKSKKNEIKLKF